MAHLIVYFSHEGQNWVNGEVKDLPKGNTERAAEIIRDAVGGDMFRVEAKEPYPEDYQALIARTKEELDEGRRPPLRIAPPSLDKYDLIFVGYPNWWNTLPMPMVTFLTLAETAGKRLAAFCTNEGGSMGMGEREMRRFCPGAQVLEGLAVKGAEVEKEAARLSAWARKITGFQG